MIQLGMGVAAKCQIILARALRNSLLALATLLWVASLQAGDKLAEHAERANAALQSNDFPGAGPPGRLAVPTDKDEILAGSACSSFGLNSGGEAVSICNQLSDATSAGKWEEAKQLASELTNRYPNDGVGYFSLGYVERKQGKYISALRHFQAAVDRNPEVALAHLTLGLSYAIIRQYKLFEDEMRWVMVNRPQESLPYYYLGLYRSNDLEQFDKGTELFQQALKRNPNDHKSRYHLGYLFELKGERQKAKAEYELAAAAVASQKMTYGWPLQGLARVYVQQDNLPEALRYARQAVSLDSKLASSHLVLGKIYIQAGELASGIAELKVAAELDPTDATPHYWLSRAYLKMKMPAEAQQEQEIFSQIKAAYRNE